MISQNAQKHAEACRFCWMCRHLCPVGLKTGREINTPRAKGLLLSLAARNTPFDADIAQSMYECMLCDACTNDCATGFEPPLYIREARTQALVEGIAPPAVEATLALLEESGNLYGEVKPLYGSQAKAETLLLVGEVAACRAPQLVESYLRLLQKAGVPVMTLAQEPPTGAILGDLMGYTQEVRQQAADCAKAIGGSGAKTLVVLDSGDAALIRQQWPEWGIDAGVQVVTAAAYLWSLAEAGRLQFSPLGRTACYHDDSRAARTLREYEPARALLAAAGVELHEMFQTKALAKCCGSSLANAYMPDITRKTAQGRWEDALRTRAQAMVTSSPQSLEVLSLAVPDTMELWDLYTLLDSVCRS